MSKEKKTNEELLEEKLIPFEEQTHIVPENWVWTTIKNVCQINMGQSPKGEYTTDNPDYVPLIGGPADMGLTYPNAKRYTTKPTKLSKEGDMIVSIRATLGKTNFADGEYCLGRGVAGLTPKYIDPKLLGYYFATIKSYLYTISTGTTFQQVSRKDIENTPLPLPPLNEQKHIAEKVERLLYKIEEAKRLIEESKKTFELRRAAILDKAFRGELSSWWRKENHAAQTSGDLIDTVKQEYYNSLGKKLRVEKNIKPEKTPFDIPKEWTWAKAIDVCDVRDGTHDSPKYQDKGFPLVTSKNLKNGELVFDNIKFISEEDHMNIKKRSKVDTGDILFAMIGTIGNPVLIKEIKEEFSIKNVALFKPLKSINEEFL
ncbi:restriction endonuclease subunit S, partial [Rossellomorea marisflavi]|uniref:restriction endonuclease subunit S n=1 Tax=Rossellomorea marisflavi TaxID=189381 RepID=UPI00069E450D